MKRLNVSLLKPYIESLEGFPYSLKFSVSSSSPAEAEPLHTVERIIKHRTLPSGALQWLVKWSGSGQPTWESADSFVDVTTQWAQYNRDHAIVVDCSRV